MHCIFMFHSGRLFANLLFSPMYFLSTPLLCIVSLCSIQAACLPISFFLQCTFYQLLCYALYLYVPFRPLVCQSPFFSNVLFINSSVMHCIFMFHSGRLFANLLFSPMYFLSTPLLCIVSLCSIQAACLPISFFLQ